MLDERCEVSAGFRTLFWNLPSNATGRADLPGLTKVSATEFKTALKNGRALGALSASGWRPTYEVTEWPQTSKNSVRAACAHVHAPALCGLPHDVRSAARCGRPVDRTTDWRTEYPSPRRSSTGAGLTGVRLRHPALARVPAPRKGKEFDGRRFLQRSAAPFNPRGVFPVPCSALLVAIELGYRISRGHSPSAGDPGSTRRVCAASCRPGGLLQQ